MAHYFTNDNAGGRTYNVVYSLGGREFRFVTSDGVFSKGHIDQGTERLILAALPRLGGGLVHGRGHGLAVDLGCGYGALGVILAALVPGLRVLMVDVNVRAVELAGINAGLNGAAGAGAVVSDGLKGLTEPVDYVLTNPPFRAGKAVVLRLFEESYDALAEGGEFFAVFRKQQGAESYIRRLEEIFGNIDILLKKKGYVVVHCKKSRI